VSFEFNRIGLVKVAMGRITTPGCIFEGIFGFTAAEQVKLKKKALQYA